MKQVRKKKILIVAESIDVEDSSGTKGRVALIRNLIKLGYDIQVYHYTKKTIEINGARCVAIKEKKLNITYLASRIERQFRNQFKLDFHKSLEKIFGFSFTLYNDRDSIIAALRKLDFKPDLIITLSQGRSFRPHHALLKLPEFHRKWLAYIHDPYPMHFYPRPYVWVEPGYYQKWKFMKNMSEKAAFAAFPSRLLMEWMGSYYKGYLDKGLVLPHQIASYSNRNEVNIPPFFNQKKFNVLHSGNLLHARDPKGLIEGFNLFLKRIPVAKNDSHLFLIGNYEYHKKMLLSKAQEIELLHVMESLPFDQVNLLQNKAAVNIILEAKSEISPFLPGKFPHCVQANKPILLLGPFYSESRRLLGQDYPFYAEVDEVEKIAVIIGELYFQWKENNNQQLNRPDLELYLSENHLKETIDKVMQEV